MLFEYTFRLKQGARTHFTPIATIRDQFADSDRNDQSRESTWHLWLEYCLDNLQGTKELHNSVGQDSSIGALIPKLFILLIAALSMTEMTALFTAQQDSVMRAHHPNERQF